jgi:hypothetical protein
MRRWDGGKQWNSEFGIRKAEKDKGERIILNFYCLTLNSKLKIQN